MINSSMTMMQALKKIGSPFFKDIQFLKEGKKFLFLKNINNNNKNYSILVLKRFILCKILCIPFPLLYKAQISKFKKFSTTSFINNAFLIKLVL